MIGSEGEFVCDECGVCAPVEATADELEDAGWYVADIEEGVDVVAPEVLCRSCIAEIDAEEVVTELLGPRGRRN